MHAAHPELEQLVAGRPDVALTISDVAELRSKLDQLDVAAWHDMDGDLPSAAAVRTNYAARLYPVTATVHVLSYQGLLHGWFLRLLLQEIHACDALVCTSVAARAAAQNIFRHTVDRLRKTHGMDLSFKGRIEVLPSASTSTSSAPGTRSRCAARSGCPRRRS